MRNHVTHFYEALKKIETIKPLKNPSILYKNKVKLLNVRKKNPKELNVKLESHKIDVVPTGFTNFVGQI